MNPTDNAVTESRILALLGAGSLIALIVLCAVWELWLAPMRPGDSWLTLKALLLAWPLLGVLRKNRYTMQWVSMFVLPFFTEGIMRATSGVGLSHSLAWGKITPNVVFLTATVFYSRPFERAAEVHPGQST